MKWKTYTIILLIALAVAGAARAATTLEVGIPGTEAMPGSVAPSVPMYIKYLYYFVLGLVGIAGFSSLVFWGAVWAGSGVVDKKAQAIAGIKNTLAGIGIALTAFILLNTINPDLIVIKMPEMPNASITDVPQKNVLGYDYTWKCDSKITTGDQAVCRADGVGLKCPTGCGEPVKPYPCNASTYFCVKSGSPTFRFSSSPMATKCNAGVGDGATQEWRLPSESAGWTMIDSVTYCKNTSPDLSYDCYGKCP